MRQRVAIRVRSATVVALTVAAGVFLWPVRATTESPPVSLIQSNIQACQSYVEWTMHMIELKNRQAQCQVAPSPRWNPDANAHYQWCLRAPPEWRVAEYNARAEHLYQCGGATRPAPQARPVDPRCDQYARNAIYQIREKERFRSCFLPPNGRWAPDYDVHYEWCLRAPEAWRGSEEAARADHLYRCGAWRRID